MTDPLLILTGEVEKGQRLPLFTEGVAEGIVTDPLLILIGEVKRFKDYPYLLKV